ncbi:hypothetical protein AAFF_G00059980 [Aldrovandia affinis]|uniref:Muscarinic acetylcholine receptor n=1 Tax=Aldrovandia affinis TaxID=143900 RepID=A0AAD7WED2_9TELE|nr:hypothetical protein AAFF_G00059980 [Aldrovandia affinis]
MAIATVSAIVSLITITGNILVMVSFKVNSQLRTVNNYYLLSLAFADLIIGIFSMNLYTSYILMGYWALGSLACDLWLSLDYVASNASVMNLLIISFDRYFSITRPLTYRAKQTPRRAGIMIGLAWLVSLVLWAPPILCWQYFIGKRTIPLRECQVPFFSEPLITFGTAIAAFYVPISVMTMLYCRIYRETERHRKDLAGLQGHPNSAHLCSTKPRRITVGSCFSCKRSSGSEENQASSSSSDPGTAAKAESIQESFRAEKVVTFSSYAFSEEDDCPAPSGTHMLDESDQLASCSEGLYATPQPESGLQTSESVVSYKSSLVLEGGRPHLGTNGDAKMAPASCSSAESTDHPSSSRATPKNQINKKKKKKMAVIKEKKAAQTLSAILLAFILTWTPYNIMVLVSTFCSDCIPPSLWHLGYWLCYVNSTVNPMCYALYNKSFRKTFRALLLCRWKRRDDDKLYWNGHCSSLVMSSKAT